MWDYSLSKTKRFDDRLSLERARHELKKNSGSLRLKICGKKLSVYSIVGFRVRFQPAAGGLNLDQADQTPLPKSPKE